MSLVQQLYNRLPPAGQNLALAAFGLGYRRQRLGHGFERYVAEFKERDRWSADEMREYQLENLHRLLRWSFTTVPYYGARWKAEGIEEGDLASLDLDGLRALPLTPKEDLRRDPKALVSTSLGTYPRLLKHLTSGSTGTPATIYLTRQTLRKFMAVREARSFGWAGVSVRMPRSTIGSRIIVPEPDPAGPVYRYNVVERQLYLSAHHIARKHLASYVEGFDRYQPAVLTGFGHSHYSLAHLMLQEGLHLKYRPRAAVLGSDKITRPMKAAIAEGLGTRAFEEYGSVENCVLATECREGSLHVSTDFGILEILNEQDEPVGPGEPGRLVCTGLLNYAQPLVRYLVGDLGVWAAKQCPCGRDSMPVLEGIVGRENDVVLMRDGRRLTTAVALIFTGVEHVVEGQVVQESFDDFLIRVIATPDFGPQQEEHLLRGLHRRLGDVRARVEVVDELETASSGKTRSVISRVSGAGADADTREVGRG